MISFFLQNKYASVTTVVDTKFEPSTKMTPWKWSTEKKLFDIQYPSG